jgi:hypothetical protein
MSSVLTKTASSISEIFGNNKVKPEMTSSHLPSQPHASHSSSHPSSHQQYSLQLSSYQQPSSHQQYSLQPSHSQYSSGNKIYQLI